MGTSRRTWRACSNNSRALPSDGRRSPGHCRAASSRALMSRPKLVMFDEPSLGLAPNIVERTFAIIEEIRASGTTVLMVEQNAYAALDMCDYAYLLESGSLALEGPGQQLIANPHVREAYLGG